MDFYALQLNSYMHQCKDMYTGTTSEYIVIFKCLNYNGGSSDKDLGSDYGL